MEQLLERLVAQHEHQNQFNQQLLAHLVAQGQQPPPAPMAPPAFATASNKM